MQLAQMRELAHVTESSPGSLHPGVEGGGSQLSDEELVVAAQSGDSCAMGELLSRHQKMLYSFARRYTANAEGAHDLVQETMLRALKNIGRFRREARFATWLVAIVIREALSIKRKEKGLQWVVVDEKASKFDRKCIANLTDVRKNPEQRFLQQELSSVLHREILRLHPRYRLLLQAWVLDETSIEQVAHSLGITPSAAKSRLHRARHSLSTAMRSSWSTCAHVNIERRTA